jgi:hypothetical protein
MIRRLLAVLAVAAAITLTNCATSEGGGGVNTYGVPRTGDARGFGWDGTAKTKRAMSEPMAPMAECAPQDRKGLATEFGPTREDKVGTTVFERDSTKPVGVVKLFYNDAAGAQAMAGGDWSYSNSFRDYAGGIFRVGLRNHRGAALSAYQSGGNLICIGEEGQRYSVEVENLSNHRLEFVVTVDGLDVLTGQSGAYSRRGYVLDPGQRREIKGWRTSVDEVATFKFGRVGEAYVTKLTGDAGNVGVIGAAVFAERGTTPRPYAGTDSYRRLRADPFGTVPSGTRFAPPPPR